MLVVIVVMVVVVVVVMAVNTVVDHLDEPHERPRQASQVNHCFCNAMLGDIRKPAGDRNQEKGMGFTVQAIGANRKALVLQCRW